ncbi:MAG: glucosyltransferase domain-containing protein [Acetobacter sp.]
MTEKPFIVLFLIVFSSSLLSFGQVLLPGYTPDDFLTGRTFLPTAFFLNQGRFTEGFIVHCMNSLHLSMFNVGFGFECLALLLYSFLITYILYSCTPQTFNRWLLASAGTYIGSSPFMVTLLNYREAAFNTGFGFAFIVCGIYYHEKYMSRQTNSVTILFSAIFSALALGCYQIFIIFVFVYPAFLLIKENYEGTRLSFAFVAKAFAAPLGSVVLYVILFAATKHLAGENDWDQRGALLHFSGIPQRLHDIYDITKFILALNLQYASVKICFAVVLVGLSMLAFLKRGMSVSLIFLAVLALYALVLLPLSILERWEPTPRTLLGIHFIIALWVVWICGISDAFNRVLAGVMFAFSLHSMMICNDFLTKQLKQNRWDMSVAWSLIKDVKILTQNQPPASLSVVPDLATYSGSTFLVPWSIKGLLYEAGNVEWSISTPTLAQETQCHSSVRFPVPGYLHHLSDNAILACM